MASFSRIMKLALALLPLASALPAVQSEANAMPTAQLADGMTVKEALSRHVPRDAGCANEHGGVHILVARGSTEPPGEGALSNIAGLIKDGIPGSDSTGIDYPALLDPYPWSVGQGTQSLTSAIEDYVKQCPKSRIVLLGYSQGAQVVMNTLCGTNEGLTFAETPRLDKKYWHHIAAALVYADPTHLAGKSYDRGTSSLNGLFPRQKAHLCKPFSKRLVAYCDWNDPVCASGWDGSVHTSYFEKYDTQAAPWMISKAKGHSPFLRHGH